MTDIDKPLEHLSLVESQIRPEPEPEPEMATIDRLRAFEDAHGHLRHRGTIEKGSGSRFQSNNPDGWNQKHRDHHAALENLIKAEEEHKRASATEAAAHSRLEAAIKRASETEEAI